MKIELLGAKLLVERDKIAYSEYDTTSDKSKKSQHATIVNVGSGVENKDLKKGTKILITEHVGMDIKKADGESTGSVLILEDDVLGIIKD